MRTCLIIFILSLSFCSAGVIWAATDVPMQQDALDEGFDADFGDEFEDDSVGTAEAVLISDPLEGYNRGVFWFNDKLYVYLFKPVARGYRVIPRPVRSSIDNFFSNLTSPVSIVNSLLQFKFSDATRGVSRLVINTTVGIGGLFDPASKNANIPKKQEDFGQTLGHFGIGSGPYFVLPLFGPSSIRDTGGRFVDIYFDPLTYLSADMTRAQYFGIKSLDFVNYLSLDDDSYEKIKRDSLDPYLFMRAAYAQYRLAKVKE